MRDVVSDGDTKTNLTGCDETWPIRTWSMNCRHMVEAAAPFAMVVADTQLHHLGQQLRLRRTSDLKE